MRIIKITFLLVMLHAFSTSAQEYYNKFSLGIGYNFWQPMGNFADKDVNNAKAGMASMGDGLDLILPTNFSLSASYLINRKWEVILNAALANYPLEHDLIKTKYAALPKVYEQRGKGIFGSYPVWFIQQYTAGINRIYQPFKNLQNLSLSTGVNFGIARAMFDELSTDTGRIGFLYYDKTYEATMNASPVIAPYAEIGAGAAYDLGEVVQLYLNTGLGFSQFNFKDATVRVERKDAETETHSIPFKQDYMNLNISAGIKFRFVSSIWFESKNIKY